MAVKNGAPPTKELIVESLYQATVAEFPRQDVLDRIVPHPRTVRKAREQVKKMVICGLYAQRIRSYLHRWPGGG